MDGVSARSAKTSPATMSLQPASLPTPIQTTSQGHHQAIAKVLLLMRERFTDELTLDAMAAHACMSPYHFNRIFRETVGIPPGQFLGALRLEAAKWLLLTTERSILDVCYDVGYNSLGTFTSRFTQLVGLPPGQFRQLGRSFTTNVEEVLALAAPAEEPCLAGTIEAPREVDGLIFLGLFPSAIPQGRPQACAILEGPGPFRIHVPGPGRHHLFVAGMARFEAPLDFLRPSGSIRGLASAGPLVADEEGRIDVDPHLTLRPPDLFDPPLLVTLPLLIDERLAERFALADEDESVCG